MPVLVAMMISLAAIFVVGFIMPGSNPCVLTKPVDEERINKLFGQEHKECYKLTGAEKVGFKAVLRLRHVPFMLLLYFLIFLAFNFFSFPFESSGIFFIIGVEIWVSCGFGVTIQSRRKK